MNEKQCKVEIDREPHIYIGNRYVPKIEGEWNILNEYENFSIVFNENIGYISKKNVPPGIELTNNEFWSKCFNLNEIFNRLENLEERIKVLEGK